MSADTIGPDPGRCPECQGVSRFLPNTGRLDALHRKTRVMKYIDLPESGSFNERATEQTSEFP